MGNCQATEAATVVIQHPGGKVERLYWPTSAEEVMRSNPGHYVALVTMYISEEKHAGDGRSVRLTRVRLLKSKDTLLLGQVYRLITSQEVTKALRARKHEKMKQQQLPLDRTVAAGQDVERAKGARLHDPEAIEQVAVKQERDRQRSGGAQLAGRARQWRPSLKSISEAGS